MYHLTVCNGLKPLAFIEGKWVTGKNNPGLDKFSMMELFIYYEEINLINIGIPMLYYIAQSSHPVVKRPMTCREFKMNVNPLEEVFYTTTETEPEKFIEHVRATYT
ncbi:hypothetical protein M0802_012678 [Mischocyttarus mexicanus]|nr:hypothetical protein M0802_012678 [Mischocyttarus mexicanus]